ncbi:hypothetical protein D3C86_2156230 [compost metagenome]
MAEGYRKLGELERARAHLAMARDGAGALPPDGLGGYTRRAIERLAGELGLA